MRRGWEMGTYLFFTFFSFSFPVLGAIFRKKLYRRDNVQACVLNMNIAFLFQLILVIPLSLFVLLVHNWVLGSFICYTLPIIQVIKLLKLIKKVCQNIRVTFGSSGNVHQICCAVKIVRAHNSPLSATFVGRMLRLRRIARWQ